MTLLPVKAKDCVSVSGRGGTDDRNPPCCGIVGAWGGWAACGVPAGMFGMGGCGDETGADVAAGGVVPGVVDGGLGASFWTWVFITRSYICLSSGVKSCFFGSIQQ